MSKIKCAIIGSGNIGTDLMLKIIKTSSELELVAVIGIDLTLRVLILLKKIMS